MEFSFIVFAECKEVGHYQWKQQTVFCLRWHVSMTNVKLASVVCYHPCLVKFGRFGSHSCQAALSDPVVLANSSSKKKKVTGLEHKKQKETSIGMMEELEQRTVAVQLCVAAVTDKRVG